LSVTTESERPATPSSAEHLSEGLGRALDVVDTVVVASMTALFETYEVDVPEPKTLLSAPMPSVQLVGIIGFSSDEFSGSLTLALPSNVLEHTLPTPNASTADWVAELSNQLLGRIKNQMLKYQQVIEMSLPVAVAGHQLRLPAGNNQITRYYVSASQLGGLFVRLDMALSTDVRFEENEGGVSDDCISEGDLMLF
jgi:hypothetical protein